jgi:hypothetical protein
MRLFRLVTGWASVLMTVLVLHAASASGEWDQLAAALSEQIAAILGPGQATLTIRNLSSIASSQVQSISSLVEQDLKVRGIVVSNSEGANAVRITLSQNDRERLWVAEVVQGSETRVVMVPVDLGPPQSRAAADYMTLRRERLPILEDLHSGAILNGPILAALDSGSALIAIRPDAIELFSFSEGGWQHQKYFPLNEHRQLTRDPRGILLRNADGTGFTAFTGESECSGSYAPTATTSTHPADGWTILCHPSDEPWPATQPIGSQASTTSTENIRVTPVRAFYNPSRNYFTGVLAPSVGVDLPPFYSLAEVSRSAGTVAWLTNGIDGKVQLVENGMLKAVSGARDWGSDFAVLRSGCGSGMQVIASGSGEATSDSLRAYELPAQEAIPASAPLSMQGTVTALWAVPDSKSVFAVVRGPEDQYEVDRVTALCN